MSISSVEHTTFASLTRQRKSSDENDLREELSVPCVREEEEKQRTAGEFGRLSIDRNMISVESREASLLQKPDGQLWGEALEEHAPEVVDIQFHENKVRRLSLVVECCRPAVPEVARVGSGLGKTEVSTSLMGRGTKD
jgi:hypothetical protein